jgi:hypothetical protein
MLFREIIQVNFENYMNHINKLFEQNEESFLILKKSGKIE